MLKKNIIYFDLFGIFLNEKVFSAEEGMPQLNPEFWASQIFWLVLIFGSLYIGLMSLKNIPSLGKLFISDIYFFR